MENGAAAAFVSPASLPPQAHLSAAFQAATAAGGNTSVAGSVSHFQEALMSRMGRPFGLTGSDLKDLAANSPFALSLAAAGRNAAAASGGAGEVFNPASIPFLSHMAAAGHPPFLQHFVDPRHPFSAAAAAAAAGAFRPFLSSSMAASTTSTTCTSSSSSTSSSELTKSFNSAFQPPGSTKLDRKGSPTLFSPGQNLFPRRSASAGSHGSPSSSPPTSISSHFLRKIDENSNTNALSVHHHHMDRHDSVSPLSIDSNHTDGEERAAKKIRVSSSSSAEYGCCCPICGIPLRPSELESHYTQELDYLAKLSAAVLINQKQQGFKSPPNSGEFGSFYSKQISPRGNSIEVAPRSRWDTFQRIQRNRQSRIRVKLSRRVAKRQDEVLEEEAESEGEVNHKENNNAKSFSQHQQNPRGDHDEDIDIVGDANESKDRTSASLNSSSDGGRDIQSHVYGPPQFTEADVLTCLREEEEENQVSPGDHQVKKEVLEDDKGEEEENEDVDMEEKGEDAIPKSADNLETLKAKLKQMEEHNKCSKCMKTLQNPVVNVGCWHIQCEKCWLISLGTIKRCSLCGLNSSPSDLRRVFL